MDSQRWEQFEVQLREVRAAQARAQTKARAAWILAGVTVVTALGLGLQRPGFGQNGNSLAAQVAALQAALAQETARAQAAESALGGRLNTELAARQQGDTDTLAAAKSYADGKVNTEATARQQGDAA